MSEAEWRGPFEAVIEMCFRLGVREIDNLEGCWECQIDDDWWIAVNGHKDPCEAKPPQHEKTIEVPPFTAYVEYNGWPAGLLDPKGGIIAAGDYANEQTFVAACEAKGTPVGAQS